MDGIEKYIIDKIVGRNLRKIPGQRAPQVFYEVRWLSYDDTTFEARSTLIKVVLSLSVNSNAPNLMIT